MVKSQDQIQAYLPKHFFTPTAKRQNKVKSPSSRGYHFIFVNSPQSRLSSFPIPPSGILKFWQFLEGKYEGSLKTHLRIHWGKKPYHCNQCPKYLSNIRNLKKHLRIHSAEKQYLCNQCRKAFLHDINLKNHFRIHSGKNHTLAINAKKHFHKMEV